MTRFSAALGPLAPVLSVPDVSDVLVNPDGSVWLDRGRGLERSPLRLGSAGRVRELAVSLIAAGGRHLDDATPCMDVHIGRGVRVHAALPPVSVGGACVSVRIPSARQIGFAQLCAAQTIPEAFRPVIRAAVRNKANVLISGGTGAGKTTLLAALLELVAPDERILTIEDVAELRIRHPHVIGLQARQPNADGRGEVGLATLVRQALRMRPDRIVLGECRGAELMVLLLALNTGHDGGAGTVHANSIDDVPARLEALAALAGVGAPALARQATSALDLLVHIRRNGPMRVVESLGVLRLSTDAGLAAETLAVVGAHGVEYSLGWEQAVRRWS